MHNRLKAFTLATLILAPAACTFGISSATTGTTGGGAHSTSAGTGGAGGTTSDGGAGTGGNGLTPQKACAEEAQALCALREACSPGYDVKKSYGSASACALRTAQSCVNSLDAMGQGNTIAHVEACAAAYPTEMCADFFDNNPIAACAAPAGTLTNGAACGASGQCESAYCAIPQLATCGTCQQLPAAGATCQVQADCGRDLACATPAGATSGTCAAWVASTGGCLTGVSPCQAGLACVGDDVTAMTMGTCQAQGITVGAACDGSRKTAPNCDNNLGLTCIPAAKGSAVGWDPLESTCRHASLSIL